MTAPPEPVAPPAAPQPAAPAPVAADGWRGVASEGIDEVGTSLGQFLRGRSRDLLVDLLRPHKRRLAPTTPSRTCPGASARMSSSTCARACSTTSSA